MKLTFHLPDQNMITLRDSECLPALLQREDIKETMFTQWFELNKRDENARKLTYSQIPEHYVWHDNVKLWKPRKQRKSIGRIVYSNPASGDRYYLRMLLNVVRGPRSFKELKTVNKRTYETCKEACNAYGLISDDKEWTLAISEARFWASGSKLRDLFVTILLFCEVNSPLQLWDQNWEALSEDILHKKRKQFKFPNLQLTETQIKNYCLVAIKELLNINGKSLSDFPELPMPDPTLLTNMDNRLIREELDYDMKEVSVEHQKLYNSLNSDQRSIYSKVVTSVQEKRGGFYFVYGPGGTGKTFLYKAIISRLRSERIIVLAVASSGIWDSTYDF